MFLEEAVINSLNFHISRKKQNIANNIVIIDGFSSSGKSLIAPIFGYLDRAEQWKLNEFYEYIATLDYFGDISRKSATALINIEADKDLYNSMIGRNVNFRNSDQTSPFYDGLYDRYLSRTKKNEGEQNYEE